MKVRCKKPLSGMTNGIVIYFKQGKEYKVFGDAKGKDFIISNGLKFFFSHTDPKFLEYFEIVDEEEGRVNNIIKEIREGN